MNRIFCYTCTLQLLAYPVSLAGPCPCPGQIQQPTEERNTPGTLLSSRNGVAAEGLINLRGKFPPKAPVHREAFQRRRAVDSPR